MQQYFISYKSALDEHILLNDEQSHHILHVMRMKAGEVIRIADVDQQLFFARVEIHQKRAGAHLYEMIEDHTMLPVNITLVQGLIKGDKWDYLLQKTSELGVGRVIPFISKRSVVKNKDEKIDKKLERWNKICKEACEQCKRSSLVKVEKPIALKDIDNYLSDLNIIAYEDADYKSDKLSSLLSQHSNVRSITYVIGCEGGFDVDEVNFLKEKGFYCVSLGTRILRAETAALSVIDNTGFYYDMIGDKNG